MPTIHFLLPAHPLKASIVDEMFADQLAAIRNAGFTASLISDAVIQRGMPLRNVPVGATVVYRGWMLKPGEYSRLVEAIAAASATPFTSLEAYLAAHLLPN